MTAPLETYVLVEREPWGLSQFNMSTATLDGDTLTVRSTDEDHFARCGPSHVFQPGHWREARIETRDGTVLQEWVTPAEAARRQRYFDEAITNNPKPLKESA